MKKLRRYILATTIVLAVVGVFVLRHVGLPQSFSGLPLIGPFLTRFIGIRLVTDIPGMYRKVEVFRGRGFVYDWRSEYFPGPPGTPDMIPPMVRADLYDAKGRRIAGLRQGTGVYVDLLYSNGVPGSVDFYIDGVACGPFAVWEAGGELMSYGYRDRRGELHGNLRRYYRDGSLKVDKTFSHGKPVGEHRKWYPDGTIRQIELFSDSDPFSIVQSYDTKGVKYAVGTRKDDNLWNGTFDWWDYVYTNDSCSLWILVYSNGFETGRYKATNPVPKRIW